MSRTNMVLPPRGGGYFNTNLNALILSVPAGEWEVSDRDDVVLATTLGSCIAAAICDPVARIGGMNHFMLPDSPGDPVAGINSDATRYGGAAMERLINALLMRGAKRDRMQVKLFGGGNVIKNSQSIGHRNARFAVEYIRGEGLNLLNKDVGGAHARSVRFYPTTGKAMVKALREDRVTQVVKEETNLMKSLRAAPVESDIELF